jgi:hypothetical protein
MSTPAAGSKHPFLDDLTAATELRSTIMRQPVKGSAAIKRIVDAVGTLYVSQTPTFFGPTGNDDRHVLQYEAVLRNGRKIEAVGIIERNKDGTVHRVTMTFAPLDSALSLSAGVGAAVPEKSELFL